MRRIILTLGILLACLAGSVRAEPALQLYVQGATYDKGTETWVINTTTNHSINVWVVATAPSKGTSISDISLIIAGSNKDGLSSTITGTNLGKDGYIVPGGTKPFFDSFYGGNAPSASLTLSGNNTTPASQSKHGIYGTGTSWNQYSLGNFAGANLVKIADMPDDKNPGSHYGYIGVYTITFNATTVPTWVNIDGAITYSSTDSKGKTTYSTKFAPYSHTARGTKANGGGVFGPKPESVSVPEPSSLAIAGLGALGLMVYGLRRRRTR